jgi:NAD(P)-dependent dehydrogenase (short-subunit alcohol dehydrogenase family)
MIRQFSEDPNNLAIGLVRDKAATENKVASEIGKERSNIHIIHADLTSHKTLKEAAGLVADIVGDRGVDYLVANGAYQPTYDAFDPVSKLEDDPEETDRVAQQTFNTNVMGNVHFMNLFVPLVLKGKTKKVFALSSGHGDLDFVRDSKMTVSPLYSASKAALNIIVAKLGAQYASQGVLFVSMSPGVIDTQPYGEGEFRTGRIVRVLDLTLTHIDYCAVSPENMQKLQDIMGKFATYAPHFKGPIQVDEAVATLRSTWEKLSLEDGFSGAFVSQHGTKQWV